MDFVKFVAPSGPQWELLVAVAVVLVAPVIVERLRLPGMVGLLFGGMAIGPNVLDVVAADSGIVAEVGGLGLLYLMFMAGLDLDLNVFAKLRRHALLFAGLTFVVPFALGMVIGFAVGYGSGAALLLGAVFASHTLVTYPIIRGYGLSTNNAVAITVGATVITDTLALIVLAVVSGQASGDVTGWELASQLAIGLAVLGVACFVVMPIAGLWYFAKIGRTRVARYTFLLGVLLAGAVVATAVGIEPIVGAFFAGLAINRLVPSEGEMMERIEFFGSAVLIPIFLVAVGTIIDPVQLVSVGTLGLAALFALGAVGGKAVAALIARFAFGLSWSEAGTMFSLSVSRAAATLAATIVGLNLGLFDTATANAIMLVIVISLIASSITATAFGSRVPRPVIEVERVGRSVLVQVAIDDDHEALTAVAARLARVDGGVVRPVYVVPPGAEVPTSARVRAIDRRIAGLGVDASLDVRHDRSLEDGLANAAASAESSLIIVDDSGAAVAQSGPGVRVPVAIVRAAPAPIERVVLVLSTAQATRPRLAVLVAGAVAVRLARSGLKAAVVCDHDLDDEARRALGSLPVQRSPILEWLDSSAGPADLVILAGGPAGALAAGRVERRAAQRGASVMVVSDPNEVEVSIDASAVVAPLTAS